MTIERAIVIVILGLFALFVLIVLFDEIDEERTESVVRDASVALGRGWERGDPWQG
jgi:type II secretory pathway pseudopilin PulG